MKFFTFSKGFRNWNEDRVFASEKFAFVIDGASPISSEKFSNFSSDAEWYAEWWKNYLEKNLAETSREISDIVKAGIKKVKRDFNKLTRGKKVYDFPSSTLSVVRKNGEKLEFFALADSPILVQTKAGMVFKISDTLNNVNDNINMAIIRDHAKKDHISIPEARHKYPESITLGRLRKNTVGHYFVLSDFVQAVDHAVMAKIDAGIVSKVLIFSDGFSQIFDCFNLYTPERAAQSINDLADAEKIYKELYVAQEQDSSCDKFPRFKIRDDTSVAAIVFD